MNEQIADYIVIGTTAAVLLVTIIPGIFYINLPQFDPIGNIQDGLAAFATWVLRGIGNMVGKIMHAIYEHQIAKKAKKLGQERGTLP